MNQKLRKSVLGDAEHFVTIKESLPIANHNGNAEQGGFLLGTNLDTYKFYIKHGICYTALALDKIVGFGIVLPNELVRQSELWEKRKSVHWNIDFSAIENNNVAYLEQLAFLKGHRKLIIALSHNLAHTAFEKGADYILTTTVRKPVINLAAVPLIKAAGGKKVGNIDEVYPEIGHINSDIYLIDKTSYHTSVKKRVSYGFLMANTL